MQFQLTLTGLCYSFVHIRNFSLELSKKMPFFTVLWHFLSVLDIYKIIPLLCPRLSLFCGHFGPIFCYMSNYIVKTGKTTWKWVIFGHFEDVFVVMSKERRISLLLIQYVILWKFYFPSYLSSSCLKSTLPAAVNGSLSKNRQILMFRNVYLVV